MFPLSLVMLDVVEGPDTSNDDFLVIYEDKLDALLDHSLSETGGGVVVFLLLNLSLYFYEDIYPKLEQIVKPA